MALTAEQRIRYLADVERERREEKLKQELQEIKRKHNELRQIKRLKKKLRRHRSITQTHESIKAGRMLDSLFGA